jgi:tetratricopeptide (TPR) repeat protein
LKLAAPAKIFISYARGDDPQFVRVLHQDLLSRSRADGQRPLKLFFDKQDMPSRGKSFLLEIRDFIGDPDTERVLLVVGPRALGSPYVQAEWRAALERCVVVVPLLRIGVAQYRDAHDLRQVDDEDYASIPAEVREARVHAIDFRERRGALPGRPYADAFEALWRVLADPVVLGPLAPDVPDLPGNFIPRADYLRTLERSLLADADDPVTVHGERRFAVLSGMGGVGKSVLAASFCRACKTRRSFKDGIGWVRMGPRPALPAELIDLLGRPQVPGGAKVGLRDLSCLIVLDDVTDPAHVARFANELGESGRLLVTTRDGAVATVLAAQRCDIDLLTEEESQRLLADWSGCAVADLPSAAIATLQECGRLPLAVAMIGAMMKGRPPDRWRHVLEDLQNANLDEIRHRFPNYDHPDLLRALQVSVDALDGLGVARDATWERKLQARRRYLELAIFPGNTPLPVAVLHRYWAPEGASESVATKLCDLFVERNLARRDDLDCIVLHDLQRDYLVAEQRGALRALNRRFLDAHRPAGGWRDAVDDGYLLGHLAGHLRQAGLAGELNGLADRAWMEKRLAGTGSHRGFAGDMEVVIEALDDEAAGDDLPALTRACLALGTVTDLATVASPSFLAALARCGQPDRAIHHASLMSDPETRIIALAEIAGLLVEQGGSDTARRLVEQVLDDAKGMADRRLQAQSAAWAARCLARLGSGGRALAAAERALALIDDRADDDARLNVLGNLSRAYLHLGRLTDARRIARRMPLWHDPALLVEIGDRRRLETAIAWTRGRSHVADESWLLLAESLLQAGRHAEAAEVAESARSRLSRIGDVHERATLQSSAAVTFTRLGERRKAEELAERALAVLKAAPRRGRYDQIFVILRNMAILAGVLGQKGRAAQFARRALKAVAAERSRYKLDYVGIVAELLCDVGRFAEAEGLLNRELAAAWVIRDPWQNRETAGVVAEALIRVGKWNEGVAHLAGLSDRFGARGRTQVRVAGALAEAGAADAAESLARSADELYRPEALGRVATALSGKGLDKRALKVATAIDDASSRALTLCRIAVLDDEAAVSEATRQAQAAANAEAMGLLAERLGARGARDAGRDLAHGALALARRYEGHAQVSALGDLGRALLAVGDEAGVELVDALLVRIDDREYRAEGRLRLALALAQAGHSQRARAIVRQELPTVEGLEGRDVPRATMLATIALVALHAGPAEQAVRRARAALVALRRTGGAWNSDYDKDLAWERAVHVLDEKGRLEEAFAAGEIGFAELAGACGGGRAGGAMRLRTLLDDARRQPEGAPRAHALACVARAFGRLGLQNEAGPLVLDALRSACHGGRSA